MWYSFVAFVDPAATTRVGCLVAGRSWSGVQAMKWIMVRSPADLEILFPHVNVVFYLF